MSRPVQNHLDSYKMYNQILQCLLILLINFILYLNINLKNILKIFTPRPPQKVLQNHFQVICPCTPLYAPVRPCTPLYAPVRPCTPLYAPVRPCTPLYAPVRPCTPLYAPVRPCTPLYAPVRPCTPRCVKT